MQRRPWLYVVERQRIGVPEDLTAGNLPAQDFREDIVGVVLAQTRLPASASILMQGRQGSVPPFQIL